MSTCSTCGFCVKNESIGAYGSMVVEAIIIVYMTLCGISFMHIATATSLIVEDNEPVLQALR